MSCTQWRQIQRKIFYPEELSAERCQERAAAYGAGMTEGQKDTVV